MADDKKYNLWTGGLPYEMQVKKLEEIHPVPEEGSVISHEVLAKIIGEAYGTSRYYGVINSWRKKLFSMLGIDTVILPGMGLRILEPAERLHHSEADFRSSLRKVKKSARRLAATPRERLDDVGKQRYDHIAIIMAKMKTEVGQAKKQLVIDLAPVKSLPKPTIPCSESSGGI